MTQLERWRGDFGDDYTKRNTPDEQTITDLAVCFAEILRHTGPVESVCEVGANVGRNLHALSRITTAALTGVEPNPTARAQIPGEAVDAALGEPLPFDDGQFDLVFTSGVLIHVPPDSIDKAVDELTRISRRWVLAVEYFNPQPQEIIYQGLDGMLWKRDYGSMFLDHGLEPVAGGFWWRQTTPFDDCNWWLLTQPVEGQM